MYNRSNPYSTKHSQGKNAHFCFSPAFSSPPFLPPPPPPKPQLLGLLDQKLPSCGLCGRRCVLEWCDGPCWLRSHPFWWVGWGLCCFSSFGRTTSFQSYYGSTVDTTVLPLIHTLGQQALRCVSRVGRSAELFLLTIYFEAVYISMCNRTYI